MGISLKRLCIYCASNDGAHPVVSRGRANVWQPARRARHHCGVRRRSRRAHGRTRRCGAEGRRRVIGVMPHGLVKREVAHNGLTALHVVDSMHERKAMLADMADAFVALPGGIGTLEEFFETWTWAQLGVHRKPVGLLDVAGFWKPLVALLDHLEQQGFLRGAPRESLLLRDDPTRDARCTGSVRATDGAPVVAPRRDLSMSEVQRRHHANRSRRIARAQWSSRSRRVSVASVRSSTAPTSCSCSSIATAPSSKPTAPPRRWRGCRAARCRARRCGMRWDGTRHRRPGAGSAGIPACVRRCRVAVRSRRCVWWRPKPDGDRRLHAETDLRR